MNVKRSPLCVDCDVDVYDIHEYAYVVTAETWTDAGFSHPLKKGDGLVCVGCLEKRLGRELRRGDFDLSVVLNEGADHEQSVRLKERLGRD